VIARPGAAPAASCARALEVAAAQRPWAHLRMWAAPELGESAATACCGVAAVCELAVRRDGGLSRCLHGNGVRGDRVNTGGGVVLWPGWLARGLAGGAMEV